VSGAFEREYDVAVVGAGPAGCAAALASAALGARTLLVDRGPAFGGNIGNAFVHTICGLCEPADDGPPRYASPGFAARFAADLVHSGAAGAFERAGRVFVLPTDPRQVAKAFARALAREAAVDCALPCELASLALEREGGLHALELAERGDVRRQRALAFVVVDASGDGDAAALAGAPTELEAASLLQNASYVVQIRGVAAGAVEGFARMQLSAAAAGAARRGELPDGCESLLFRPGVRAGEAFVTVNLRKPERDRFDPLDAQQRERLAARARSDARALVDFLRRARAGFESAELGDLAPRIGVREGRRVVGLARIEASHVLAGERTPDEVARACWPIELWHGHERARFDAVAGACSVPLGALVAKAHARLGMAGRCLSASHEALGSLRVIGTALATGEAIGIAAALAARERTDLARIAPARIRSEIAQRTAELAAP